MKTLLLLLFSATCFAQDVSFDKSTSFKQIVATLFDGKVQKETGEVAWKPNVAEQFQFRSKAGETLYTVIDTIFEKEGFDGKYLILVTTTYPKVDGLRDVTDSHSAPAMGLVYLWLAEGRYTVNNVFKFVAHTGSWGEAALVQLIRLKDGYPVLVLREELYGSGIKSTDVCFYFYGKHVLRLTEMKTNVYAVEEGSEEEGYDYHTLMTVDEAAGRLTFTRSGTILNAQGHAVDASQVSHYTFDEYSESFIKDCE